MFGVEIVALRSRCSVWD